MQLLKINAFEIKPRKTGVYDAKIQANIILTCLGIHVYFSRRFDSYFKTWKIEGDLFGDSLPYQLLVDRGVSRFVLFRNGIFPWGCCATWEDIENLCKRQGVMIIGRLSDLLHSMAAREEESESSDRI